VSIFAPVAPPRTLILEEEGTALPLRSRIDVQGAGATVTDDPANNQLILSIPGGGGGSASVPFINVKTDYGAVGDGTTNDTTAIQNALTAALPTNADYNATSSDPAATVVFPPGQYMVDPLSLWIPQYCTVRLVGMGRAMLKQRTAYSPVSTPILTLQGSGFGGPTEGRVEVTNLEFVGTTVYGSATGLRLKMLAYCDVKNVYGHSLTTGIDMDGVLVSWFYNVNVAGCGQGVKVIGNAEYAAANHNIFQNSVIRGCTGGGMLVSGGGGVKILGVNVELCATYGIKLDTADASTGAIAAQAAAHVIENCWFEGNTAPGVLVATNAPLSILRGNYHFDAQGQPTYDGVQIEANRVAPTIVEQCVFDTRFTSGTPRVAVTNGAGSHQVRVQQCVLRTNIASAYTATISNSGSGLTQTDNFT
jgi:hypothetical protein